MGFFEKLKKKGGESITSDQVSSSVVTVAEQTDRNVTRKIKYTPLKFFEATENRDGTVSLALGDRCPRLLAVPPYVDGKPVVRLVCLPSSGSALGVVTKVILPDTLTTLNGITFNKMSNLRSITIGKGITELPKGAFENRLRLRDVSLPNSLRSIGASAFRHCPELREIHIPDGVISIGEYAFSSCQNLERVTLPASLKSIETSAFWGCNQLSEIFLPDSLISIGNNAFNNTNVWSVEIPANVEYIGCGAFSDCNRLSFFKVVDENKWYKSEDDCLLSKDGTVFLQYPKAKAGSSFTVPRTVTQIYSLSFSNCQSLTSISLPDSVAEIGNGAFWNVYKLSVSIPKSVRYIGRFAFATDNSYISSLYIDCSLHKKEQAQAKWDKEWKRYARVKWNSGEEYDTD